MTASVSIDPAVRREVQSDYFRYLLPTLIGQIAHSFYCMADVFFVGAAVGSDGLAALNVALPVFTLFSAFSLMVGVGTATTASILTGQGQTQQTNRVFTQSMVLLAVVGLTLTLLTSVFIVPLARVFGATDRILTEVVDYMRPINLLAFAYIFSGALGVIIRADGNPRLVMIAGTTGNICNIVLDYVFTMKLGMGMFGAGLATILGHCVAVLLYLLHFALHQNHLHLTRNFFDPAACVRVLRNGIGSSILELSAGLIVLLFNIALLRVSGEAAVAIFSVLSNIAYVGKGVFNGMAQAAQPILRPATAPDGMTVSVPPCAEPDPVTETKNPLPGTTGRGFFYCTGRRLHPGAGLFQTVDAACVGTGHQRIAHSGNHAQQQEEI